MYQFVKPSLSFATLMESKQEVDFSEDSGDDEAVFAIRSVAASSVPEFNAEVFAAQPLRKQFVEAQRLFVNQAEKSKVGAKAALDRFLIVQKGIMQAAIFSNNESVEEIATGDLKYLLVHSYLAKLYLFASDFETNARIQSLKDSLKSSFDYLSLCQAFELLAPHDQMLWRQLKQTLKNLDRDDLKANSAKDTLNASQLREIKIAQFKTKKENQQKLAAIQAKMEKLKSKNDDDDEVDDEMEREFLLVTIQDSIGECLSDASINLSELDLLKQRQKLLEQNPKADQNVPLSNKATKVIKIDQLGRVTEVPVNSIDSKVHERCNLREKIFRNANPSTVTIEEMARIEMENMQVSAPEKTPAELEEEEYLKEKEKYFDRETLKAREWDNWKDDNEKGIGNRMLR